MCHENVFPYPESDPISTSLRLGGGVLGGSPDPVTVSALTLFSQ